MKDYGHCILRTNGVYFSESVFDGIYKDFKFFLRIFIEGICIVALALVVMTMRGSTFHPMFI